MSGSRSLFKDCPDPDHSGSCSGDSALKKKNHINKEILYIHTLSRQVSLPVTSVCSKTTLHTGGVGGVGAGPPTCKTGRFFLSHWH